MSQPQQTIEGFFSGGGGKGIKFPTIGTSVTGTITAVHAPEIQIDPATQQPSLKKDGTPKMQIRINLSTTLRDPEDSQDDGSRTLYVKSYMTGAIGDALRKAGVQGAPQVGATLTVTHTGEIPPERPGLSATKLFTAEYVAPTAAAAGQFFAPPAQSAPVPQPSISGQGYVQPPVQQQAPAPTPPPAVIPPRPEAISEQAWIAMDDNTKINLAATMANVPPF